MTIVYDRFEVIQYTAVVGQNPECADYDNPRGLIFAERYFIRAESKEGYRVAHHHVFTIECDANLFRDRVETRAATGRGIDLDFWTVVDPAYGSQAYIDEDTEYHRAIREREDDLIA
jgi:hypothetical protein